MTTTLPGEQLLYPQSRKDKFLTQYELKIKQILGKSFFRGKLTWKTRDKRVNQLDKGQKEIAQIRGWI